jgi:hypothetical protein
MLDFQWNRRYKYLEHLREIASREEQETLDITYLPRTKDLDHQTKYE